MSSDGLKDIFKCGYCGKFSRAKPERIGFTLLCPACSKRIQKEADDNSAADEANAESERYRKEPHNFS